MDNQTKVLIAALAVVAAIVAVVLLQPRVEESLAPRLVGALVAVEPREGGVARVGRVELAAGEPFTLRAVLVAETRQGERIYYTEASRLEVAGEAVPAERLRAWDRGGVVRVRWFTVEGTRPYFPLAEPSLAAFEIRPFLRTDWPLTWSIPGDLDPAFDDHLVASAQQRDLPFGTQRYRVQFEFYAADTSVVPERSVSSPGVEALREDDATFPAVVARLPGAAGPASRVFGLSQLDPPPGAPPELLARIDELSRRELAFSRLTVLRDQLAAAGLDAASVPWRPVELGAGVAWGGQVRRGDLLRAGDRVVVLYEDRGEEGVLDAGDLAFDFVQGMSVVPLGTVFAGPVGEGELQHARLGGE